jgi:uncharacterized damage-inducible protein DinB
MSVAPGVSASPFISGAALLAHWQGHRRLTRRVIDVFPEDKLLGFTISSMRPFGAMAMESISIAEPMVREIVTGRQSRLDFPAAMSKSDILRLWDESTDALNHLWPQILPDRFQETVTMFGRYTGRVHDLVLYAIDNETHHRGQGYVYLRALGIEPPAFYERE